RVGLSARGRRGPGCRARGGRTPPGGRGGGGSRRAGARTRPARHTAAGRRAGSRCSGGTRSRPAGEEAGSAIVYDGERGRRLGENPPRVKRGGAAALAASRSTLV